MMCTLKTQISLSWSEEEVGTLVTFAKSVTSSCTSRRYPLSMQRGVWGTGTPAVYRGIGVPDFVAVRSLLVSVQLSDPVKPNNSFI